MSQRQRDRCFHFTERPPVALGRLGDGGKIWLVRFSPDELGRWSSSTQSADPNMVSIPPRDHLSNRKFGNEAWLSYVMQQLRDAGEFLANGVRDARIYNKPVVNDEYGYHVNENFRERSFP